MDSSEMVITTLTDDLIADGKSLVEELDKANVELNAALWLQSSDEKVWKLVLSFPKVAAEGPKAAYAEVQKALAKLGSLNLSLSDIVVVRSDHPWLQLLRRVIPIAKGIHSIRFSRNTIDGVFIPDAFIYRMLPIPKPPRGSSWSSSSTSGPV